MSEINVQEFFETEFPNFAVYNLYRMVGSYVDGLKPSHRKIIYTMQKSNITKPIKVSQLAAKTSEMTHYMHGETNLQGVIVNMAQDFTGTNNMNLLFPESSFGNRCFPAAAAARYIYTRKIDNFDSIFHPEDNKLLIGQIFEGEKIEPKFYIPTLPLILINGSEGIGSGWAQKILPRNPVEIKKILKTFLKNGKLPERIAPWYKGFKGKVVHLESNTWQFHGVIEKVNLSTLKVTELPPNVTLDRYVDFLTKLEDEGKITSFTDYSDSGTNSFEFEIKVRRNFTDDKDDEQLLRYFKLIKKVTENFTCMDENNTVREFQNELEILKAYIDIRQQYYGLRKASIIRSFDLDLRVLDSKSKFIGYIVQGKLAITKLTKDQTIQFLEDDKFDFVKVSDSYNYLLNMPIHSITTDNYDKLQKEIAAVKAQIEDINSKTEADLWLADI